MDLSNMTPKDKMMYEVMMERKDYFLKSLADGIIPLESDEIIYEISRAEYKRGKADGINDTLVAESENHSQQGLQKVEDSQGKVTTPLNTLPADTHSTRKQCEDNLKGDYS